MGIESASRYRASGTGTGSPLPSYAEKGCQVIYRRSSVLLAQPNREVQGRKLTNGYRDHHSDLCLLDAMRKVEHLTYNEQYEVR